MIDKETFARRSSQRRAILKEAAEMFRLIITRTIGPASYQDVVDLSGASMGTVQNAIGNPSGHAAPPKVTSRLRHISAHDLVMWLDEALPERTDDELREAIKPILEWLASRT